MDSLPRPLGNEAEWLYALWFGSARGLSNDSCVYERVREREEKERETEHLFQGSVYCRFHLVCLGKKFGERNFFWAWYKIKVKYTD